MDIYSTLASQVINQNYTTLATPVIESNHKTLHLQQKAISLAMWDGICPMSNRTVAHNCKLTVSGLQVWLFCPIGAHQLRSSVYSQISMQSYIHTYVCANVICMYTYTTHTQASPLVLFLLLHNSRSSGKGLPLQTYTCKVPSMQW